jgi:hypothetical protein
LNPQTPLIEVLKTWTRAWFKKRSAPFKKLSAGGGDTNVTSIQCNAIRYLENKESAQKNTGGNEGLATKRLNRLRRQA